MRTVVTEDKDGYLHRMLVRDDMSDDQAHMGIPDDPPDLDALDWEQIKRELHNTLVKRDIISIKDAKAMKNLSNSILSVLQTRLIHLYKIKQAQLKNTGG